MHTEITSRHPESRNHSKREDTLGQKAAFLTFVLINCSYTRTTERCEANKDKIERMLEYLFNWNIETILLWKEDKYTDFLSLTKTFIYRGNSKKFRRDGGWQKCTSSFVFLGGLAHFWNLWNNYSIWLFTEKQCLPCLVTVHCQKNAIKNTARKCRKIHIFPLLSSI